MLPSVDFHSLAPPTFHLCVRENIVIKMSSAAAGRTIDRFAPVYAAIDEYNFRHAMKLLEKRELGSTPLGKVRPLDAHFFVCCVTAHLMCNLCSSSKLRLFGGEAELRKKLK